MTIDQSYLDDLPLAGDVVGLAFDGWTDLLRREFEANAQNGNVGGVLLSETDRLRVWAITLGAGERLPAHRHVLDYMWTALTPGASLQHTHDGTTRAVRYNAGETRNYIFESGEFLLHDLENTGTTTLSFITVELKNSANEALTLNSGPKR
ncbi:MULTISPECIES: hypothetical protein [unclassified Rhodococcus (in: high G+C Gram-positive bacteria)]|uniref:hypothetical protein n=1 Tax=unclassified Rhodococcus (in: high G+C Gram-positive bacteria) TaxID=192944 RepID=UPI00339443DE